MSRFPLGRSGGKGGANENVAADPLRYDSAALAEEIGAAALALAKRANAAGLTTLGFLLESAALEAGAESVARRWPSDARSVEPGPFTAPPPRSPRSKTPRAPGGRR